MGRPSQRFAPDLLSHPDGIGRGISHFYSEPFKALSNPIFLNREWLSLQCTPCWLNGHLLGNEVKWPPSLSPVILDHRWIIWHLFRSISIQIFLFRSSIWNSDNLTGIRSPMWARIWRWLALGVLRFWSVGSRLVRFLDAIDSRLSISSSENIQRRKRLHLQFFERLHQKGIITFFKNLMQVNS